MQLFSESAIVSAETLFSSIVNLLNPFTMGKNVDNGRQFQIEYRENGGVSSSLQAFVEKLGHSIYALECLSYVIEISLT